MSQHTLFNNQTWCPRNPGKSTPGPWTFRKGSYTPKWREDTYLVETGNLEHQEGGQIAHMCLEANARLIAAAPEMLAFIKKYLISLELAGMKNDATSEARALLARMEGDA